MSTSTSTVIPRRSSQRTDGLDIRDSLVPSGRGSWAYRMYRSSFSFGGKFHLAIPNRDDLCTGRLTNLNYRQIEVDDPSQEYCRRHLMKSSPQDYRINMRFLAVTLLVVLGVSDGFQGPTSSRQSSIISWNPSTSSARQRPRLFSVESNNEDQKTNVKRSTLKRVLDRFDTIKSAGLEDVKVAGLGDKIKSLHGPKTYLLLALAAGLKWKWCFRNPYYWFGVAFCIKWYRARYVFKIPVWDRQPNWNNIITSKEQEKDLKAYTCLNCGSTIFIAKTREFFFEGDTGIGGLGCFACGAKGKENFVMDRDRIVDDVADMDDYFEYERPLDFVSRAERRKLLKEAGGSEERANEILMARAGAETAVVSPPTTPTTSSQDDTVSVEDTDISAELVVEEELSVKKATSPKPKKKKKKKSTITTGEDTAPKKKKPSVGEDDLDVLGMD